MKAITTGLSPLLAPLVAYMAESGTGTNACLRRGALPLPVHFYSPVPDIPDLQVRHVWDQRSDLAGIDFRAGDQLNLLRTLGEAYGDECDWPSAPTSNPLQFYTHNDSFGFGCAASLHCMLRYFKPRRVIEIGSGFSSRVISTALQKNLYGTVMQPCDYTIIDPYPGKVVEAGLPMVTRLYKERVELVDRSFFEQLEEGDILFIDSSHTVKIGSDVNFLFLDVLPRLAQGVIVHVHDVGLPYEYSQVYAVNPAFRMFWTEAYLLQAFLAFNSQFEILLAMNYLMTDHSQEFCAAFKHFNPQENWANSGSFWIRRRLKSLSTKKIGNA